MLLANDSTGRLTWPERTGLRGTCPGCEDTVVSKVGMIVRPHWAHHNSVDCDTWSGGETDWHLGWKQLALDQLGWEVEVPMREEGTLHRADAVHERGHIVEFQHSGLSLPALEERSDFYGRHGVLCWVFDGGVRQWRNTWWEWTKRRREPCDGISFVALDEIGRDLQKSRFKGGSIWTWDREKVTRLGSRPEFISWLAKKPGVEKPCWTCGAAPVGTFSDGSPRYDCHRTSGIPHGPTTSPTPLYEGEGA